MNSDEEICFSKLELLAVEGDILKNYLEIYLESLICFANPSRRCRTWDCFHRQDYQQVKWDQQKMQLREQEEWKAIKAILKKI